MVGGIITIKNVYSVLLEQIQPRPPRGVVQPSQETPPQRPPSEEVINLVDEQLTQPRPLPEIVEEQQQDYEEQF